MARPSISDRRWRPQLVLGTRLGRRFAALFVLCALVPVALFGVLADRAVSDELRAQAFARVQRAAKDAATSIYQQLTLLDEQLAAAILTTADSTVPEIRDARVQRVVPGSLTTLTGVQQARAREGKPLLLWTGGSKPVPQLVRWAPVPGDSARTVLAELDLMRVVGGVSGLDLVPSASVLCMTQASVSLGCVKAVDSDADGKSPIESRSTVFLRYAFGAPELILTLSESDELAYAPLYRFRSLFIPVALGAFCLAALIAQTTIRRQTAPLASLDAGTRRIAAGDFGYHVDVNSDDEFGQLAGAFNTMTRQLDRQFNTLELRHDVDTAILGAQSRAEVVDVVLSRIRDVVSCDAALMLMPPVDANANAREGWRIARGAGSGPPVTVTLSDAERAEIATSSELGYSLPAGVQRRYLQMLPALRAEVFPVRVNGATDGAIILGVHADRPLAEEERHRVRQIVTQVSVAFSNLSLLRELRALNSGALEALARTTDAASPWTAGHSTRVTAIAVALAQADGRDDGTVELVRRGALLHDIGKLAVPAAILDKPAALTAEERAVMNAHPEVGARILAPIAAFAPLLPMVRSHHERWDGKGYPDQLRGEEIHPLARLLAVADVAESMLAARPYRAPLPLDYVVQHIRDNVGKHFDPHFAQLFVNCVDSGDTGLLAALANPVNAAHDMRLREVA